MIDGNSDHGGGEEIIAVPPCAMTVRFVAAPKAQMTAGLFQVVYV
jgi:hypothetical protein